MSKPAIKARQQIGVPERSERLSLNAACHECGRPCRKLFCRASCRMAWHNRRMSRGATAHDLLVQWRRERMWSHLTLLAALADQWVAEDKAAGRTHYLTAPTSLMLDVASRRGAKRSGQARTDHDAPANREDGTEAAA